MTSKSVRQSDTPYTASNSDMYPLSVLFEVEGSAPVVNPEMMAACFKAAMAHFPAVASIGCRRALDLLNQAPQPTPF